ncbi:MAG: tetratricopeptide repeat protein [Bacteroidota bacterium]
MKKHWTYFTIFGSLVFPPSSYGTSIQRNTINTTSTQHVLSQNLPLDRFTKIADEFYDKGSYFTAHQIYEKAIHNHLRRRAICGCNLENFKSMTPLRLPNYEDTAITNFSTYEKERLQLAQTINNLGMLFEVWQPCNDIIKKKRRYEKALYYYKQSLRIRSQFPLSASKEIGKSRHNIGGILINLGRYVKAIKILKTSLSTSWKEEPEVIDTCFLIVLAFEKSIQDKELKLKYGEYQKVKILYEQILSEALLKLKNIPLSVRKTEREIKNRLKAIEEKLNKLPKPLQTKAGVKKPKMVVETTCKKPSSPFRKFQIIKLNIPTPTQGQRFFRKFSNMEEAATLSDTHSYSKKRKFTPSHVVDLSYEKKPPKKRIRY